MSYRVQELSLIQSWQSRTVLVLGDVMLDCYLTGRADRLCQEAPVPVVAVEQQQDYPGGAANVAANLASLGGEALLVSVLGCDPEGDRLRQNLRQRGVSTGYLLHHEQRQTLSKCRVMAGSHFVVRVDRGSTALLEPEDEQRLIEQVAELFPICDALILSDYNYGVITPRLIQHIAALQETHTKPVVVDSKTLDAFRSIGATAVKPNYAQAIQLLQLPPQRDQRVSQLLPQGDRLLHLTGAAIVAVTLDREGVVVFERDQVPLQLATLPVPAHHTSGAGDTFISALTLALLTGASTQTAIRVAMQAAATVVQTPGTTTCTATGLGQTIQTVSLI